MMHALPLKGAEKPGAAHHLRLPKIIGVTVPTSIDQQTLHTDLRILKPIEIHVLHLAQLTQQAGLTVSCVQQQIVQSDPRTFAV